MTDKKVSPLERTAWAPLVDVQRLKHKEIAAALRRLAIGSIDYLFPVSPGQGHAVKAGDSPKKQPTLLRADLKLLRPLLGNIYWTKGERRRAKKRLLRPIQLTPRNPRLASNDIAILIAASTRRMGRIARFFAGRNARRSTLLGGERLLGILEEAAWSDPLVVAHLLKAVRSNWRCRTFFHPDEPEWPTTISTSALRILVAAALRRPGTTLFERLMNRRINRVLAGLDAGLADAARRVSERAGVEQLIVVDAVAGLKGKAPHAVANAVATLSIAALPAYKNFFGVYLNVEPAAGSGTAAAPIAAVSDRADMNVPGFIERLASGTL